MDTHQFEFSEEEEDIGLDSSSKQQRDVDDEELLVENLEKLDFSSSDSESDEDDSSSTSSLKEVEASLVEKKRPAWACRYCGVSTPNCVAKVMESGKYFCNATGGTTASHLIQHMVRARHKELCLHPDSPLGETLCECYNCGSRNTFNMGFLPKGDGVVILLCRNCLGIGALRELGWDHEAWMPLVKERALVPWLVSVPSPDELRFNCSAAQIERLEQLWKTDPNAQMEDLDKQLNFEEEPQSVLLRYEDGYHFQNIFGPLVQIEADYDREMKEALTEDNVSFSWNPRGGAAGGKWTTAEVQFSPSASESLRLTMGDELHIRLSSRLQGANKPDWEAKATVVGLEETGPTTIEVKTSTRPPMDVKEGYTVSFVWKPVTFDRMQMAMKKFAMDNTAVSNVLYRKILGNAGQGEEVYLTNNTRVMGSTNAPGLPELNPSQSNAVQQVLNRPLALIQGPPGTGKTVTLASLVYHMVKSSSSAGGGPVLVCAPSNVAVDHLAERIHQTGVKVVRLCAKSREHIDSTVPHLTLHTMIAELESLLPTASATSSSRRKGGNDDASYHSQFKKLERDLLRSADVVCCTCSGAGDPRLATMRFRRVLIDEATQATEPESLIPMVLGCDQYILVGDHAQLGPVVMSKRAATAGLNSSLFERLVTLGVRPVRLQVQYRMHPCLSEWPSNTFYEGSLQNGVTAQDRSNKAVDFPWMDPKRPMMFYSCQGSEEIAATGTSYLNRMEAQTCEKVVSALIRGGISAKDVGVITPYEAQRAFIVSQLAHFGSLKASDYAQVEVSSVDAFQGREKEYIVMSCVRSNEKQGIGFLNDPRRLNVALTRAKRGLVILGNPRVLAKRPLWNDLLVHFRQRDLLVEGALTNLQPSLMRFPAAKKYYKDPRQRLLDQASQPVFSGDIHNPYGDVIQPPESASGLGFGFGDYDYMTTQQSQQTTSHTSGFYYQDRSSVELLIPQQKSGGHKMFDGPATQMSQKTTQSSQT